MIAEVPEADERDVDRAVAAAHTAFDSGALPDTTAQDRGRILFRLAERVRKEAAPSPTRSRDSGKPIVEAESISPMRPPASNIMAEWRPRFWATRIRYPIMR